MKAKIDPLQLFYGENDLRKYCKPVIHDYMKNYIRDNVKVKHSHLSDEQIDDILEYALIEYYPLGMPETIEVEVFENDSNNY